MLNVNSTDTIHRVKGRIEDESDIPFNKQRLVFDGHILENKKCLRDYTEGTVRMNTVIIRIDIIERITLFRNSSMCTFIPLISDIQIS